MSQRYWIRIALLGIYFFFHFFAFTAQAAVPMLLSQQGRALDSAGKPVAGVQTLRFIFYDKAGKTLWKESSSVTFSNGYYSLLLGSTTAIHLSVLENKEVWMGITIGSGIELKPRIRLTSVPYSLLAHTATHVKGGVVDAKSIKVSGKNVINGKGEWVGVKTGLQGSKGDKGDKGDKGVKGDTGVAGAAGVAGVKGDKGSKGNKGDKGTRGLRGVAGAKGTVQAKKCSAGQSLVEIKADGSSVCKAFELPGARAYYFSGSLATQTEWHADVIFNGNYKRFCKAIGKIYVKATTLNAHFKTRQENGYFYKGWYYVGTRFCANDTHTYGNNKVTDPYNVWRYNGSCGCCIERAGVWGFERSAIIWCR